MPWIKFERDFDYHVPGQRSLIAYKRGMVVTVPREAAEAAKAAGAARATHRPKDADDA